MRQRQRKLSCGVEIAATCTRLPPTPALPSTAARAAAQAGGLGVLHLQRSPIQLLPIELLDRCVGPAVAISTKPKPRERPVSRSITTAADSTTPACANTSRNRSVDVEKAKPPMKSF